ncbi:MAG: DNA-protecting protein DprA [Deltaproteobacteria bacterium]|nr:DNA-protecting protein DprA [Deltaproteobacteria bacterium]
MQGKLLPPPNLVSPDDQAGVARHREALGIEMKNRLASERDWMRRNGCRYWLPEGTQSIERLADDAPRILFLRGELDHSAPAVAIVGSRKADSYGMDMASRLGRVLGWAGVTVISGGALGIDRAAHEGALNGGGRTLAIMAGGLATLHPPGNADLFARILETGSGLLSEHPVGRKAERWTFPRRNRLIAALADAVVVVQAGRVSGALNTAAWALKLDVPLFAVPADAWYLESQGTVSLLGRGALPLARPSDLACVPALEELGRMDLPWPKPVHRPRGIPPPWKDPGSSPGVGPLKGAASPVAKALADGPRTMDELVAGTGLPPGMVQAAILDLEINGSIARIPGGLFMLAAGNR